MIRKLRVILLVGVICLLGVTSVWAVEYNEAPMLRVKVAAGELPPVEERLPEEPFVLEPLEEIGEYGGTINAFAPNNLPWVDMGEMPEGASYLLRLTEDGKIVGDMAKGYELSDDQKSLTLYLRRGLKWSDGYPFTADDILFMYEDVHGNPDVSSWGGMESVKRLEKIDDYTVRFEFDKPTPAFAPSRLAAGIGTEWFFFHPKHYMEKWHIKYNPDANELAKEEGFDSWVECFEYHFAFAPRKDMDKPTMFPWVMKEFTTTTKVFERNPYYHVVDTAGNQLPYIDRIVIQIVNQEVYSLKIISGEADVAYVHVSLADYPLYKENEEQGGYRVVAIPGILGANPVLSINQNHPDPVLGALFQDVRFRQALSVAVNREEINETLFFGLGTPRQATVLPSVSFYKEEWAETYAEYDPEEANRLLDEIGLTERDGDGFRIGRDGETVLVMVEYTGMYGIPTTLYELLKEYWEAVGLKVLLKLEEEALYRTRMGSVDHQVMAGEPLGGTLEITFYTWAGWTAPPANLYGYAPAWGGWLEANRDVEMGEKTLDDFEEGKLPGEEPPDEIKQLFRWASEHKETVYGSKEYMELAQKILDFHAEKLYLIGTVGMEPTIFIAKNNVGNIPKNYAPDGVYAGNLSYFSRQFFLKQ